MAGATRLSGKYSTEKSRYRMTTDSDTEDEDGEDDDCEEMPEATG